MNQHPDKYDFAHELRGDPSVHLTDGNVARGIAYGLLFTLLLAALCWLAYEAGWL